MQANAIDISLYQSRIDPTQTRMDYVIIKATQRNYTDPQFYEHINKVLGKMPFGCYHFIDCSTAEESVEQARYFLSVIEPYKAQCPFVYLDCEVYTLPRMKNLSKRVLTDICIAFLKECKSQGYIPVLYSNPDHLNNKLDLSRLKEYRLWVASYGSIKPAYDNLLLWQFGTGEVANYTGVVDLDIHYFTEAEYAIMQLACKDFINTPAYWINNYKNVKYLDLLLIKANNAYKYRWSKSSRVDWALAKLREDGVVNTPSYWEKQANNNNNIKWLLLKLGGGVK